MIDRRGFLKVVLASAASELILPRLELVVPRRDLVDLRGHVRELVGYDIIRDEYIVRYDLAFRLHGKLEQFHVSLPVRAKDDIRIAREPCLHALESIMQRHRSKIPDLIALPVPNGYQPPTWSLA